MNETYRVRLTPSMARKIARLSRAVPNVEVDPLILEIAGLSGVDDAHVYDLTPKQQRLVQDLLDFDLRAIVAVPVEFNPVVTITTHYPETETEITTPEFSNMEWVVPIIRAASLTGVEHFIVNTSRDKDEICRAIYHHGYGRNQIHVRSRLTPSSLEDLHGYRRNGLLLIAEETGLSEYPGAGMEFPRTVIVTSHVNAKQLVQFTSLPSMETIADNLRLKVNSGLGLTGHLNDLFNVSMVMMSRRENDEEKI